MLYLFLMLLVTFVIMAALLWGGTSLGQRALYEEPPTELYWRAPAAAGAICGFYLLWCLLNYSAADPSQVEWPYDTIFNAASEITSEPIREFWALKDDQKVLYKRRTLSGTPPRYEYRDENNTLWQLTRAKSTDTILIKEKEAEVRFKADPVRQRFQEEGGRRFLEENLGITTPRTGRSLVSILINALHLGVLFVALWLLLRFQWPHALGLAGVLWLGMTFVVPVLFAKIPRKPVPEKVAREISRPWLTPRPQVRYDHIRL